MSGYDYGNARLHAMKARLLPSRELEALVNIGSLQGLLSALTKTAYQKAIEAALTRTSGMECIEDALRSDLGNTVGKIGSFYSGDAEKMVALVLRSYDIHNLKAILRGLSKNVPAGDILRTLLPIGELKFLLLRELSRLRSPREVIDTLASMGKEIAHPLVTLRTERPGAQLFELELALERWHYQALRNPKDLDGLLAQALMLEVDLANVLTVLRFARYPAERKVLQEYFGDEQTDCMFIGSGHINFETLREACHRDNVPGAIETLASTALAPALQAGLIRYKQSQLLSEIEKELKDYQLQWLAKQIVKDPLGIGVVLGYIAVKTNEVNNIRWIAHGIDLGLPVKTIRDELAVVP